MTNNQTALTALQIALIEKQANQRRRGYKPKASDKRRAGQSHRQFEREMGTGDAEC